jgi:hypothetical protein
MKKFAIAAVAAIVATASLSSVAEARHRKDHFGGPTKVIIFKQPRCSTTKIVKIGHHGKKSVTIVKKCR